jgi:hypothetical protein
MRNRINIIFFAILISASIAGSDCNAQIFAPNRNWNAATQYVRNDKQDSVFVFFGANTPSIRAQFSDSSASTFTWYKYNELLPQTNRFSVPLAVTDSVLSNIGRGGYKVDVKRVSDDSIQTYIAWVVIDNVTINDLVVYRNGCDALELLVRTTPNFFDISALFAYNDLSVPTHQEKNILGTGGYFANHNFQSLSSQVVVESRVFSLPFIFVQFNNTLNGKTHGPLAKAAYKLAVTPPFGRSNITIQTPEVDAVATKSDFDIKFWDDTKLDFGSPQTAELPKGEALLEIKLESKAQNADSIYWNIINDKLRFEKGGDSILWQDSSIFAVRKEALPPKNKMIPGFYEIEHISSKITNGLLCRDSLTKPIEVDTSFIRNIPNVFTPGGSNPYFKLGDQDFKSIKSFKISILSRGGKQIYRWVGDPKEWEGWNGKVDGTKGDAPTGVYYFVIDAVGWDGIRYRNGQYKGFLHLYR